MARSLRIEYAGAVYHVLCRGDRREAIYRDPGDYKTFLDTLEQVCERAGFKIHAYVLMPNHYHLLLETPEPNLVAGMKWFQGTYTQRFNSRYGVSGHLFQGRYKAIPVDSKEPAYFQQVSDYIHLNPARAGLLHTTNPRLRDYPWSSYPGFVRGGKLPSWLVRERVFRSHQLSGEGKRNQRRYALRMEKKARECLGAKEDDRLKEEWETIRRGWYMGSDEFRDRLLDLADPVVRGRKRRSYRGEGLAAHDERAAVRRLDQACKEVDVALPALWGRRQTDPEKQAVAWWVKSHSVVSDDWLCAKLEMGSRTNIHRAVQAFRAATDRGRRNLKRKLQLCAD